MPVKINYRNKIYLYLSIFLLAVIGGCLTAGTHGSISIYQYPVTKHILEKAVMNVITTSPNIQRDTAKAWNDSTKNDYYNDGTNYVSISISKGELENSYTLKYAGDITYWNTSKMSQIFIAYAFDKEGNGGSSGDGGVAWYKFGLKEKLLKLFESDFIEKLDAELKYQHIKID